MLVEAMRTCRGNEKQSKPFVMESAVPASEIVVRSPASMLRASSVAIVGASERARWSSQIFSNLRQFGYDGRIVLVNPRQQKVFGETCLPSLRNLSEPVDH